MFKRLAVSPLSTRAWLLAAIGEETRAGRQGRIVLKTNGLTDPRIIDALYAASAAGVSVDLIVRGRCCLRPGVPGLSEGIRVRSIVGRYLEHSRVFRFGGTGGRPLVVAIGSPDLMERNLDRRVEVVVPLSDPDLSARVVELLDLALADRANSWTLGPDAGWTRLAGPPGSGSLGLNLQDQLRARALEALRARREAIQHDAIQRPPSVRPEGSAAAPVPEVPLAAPPRRWRWWRRGRANR